MKYIFITTLLLLSSCSNVETTSKNKKKKKEGLMPENDMCICMAIYQPVCGRDGKTYANACEAGCKKVRFKEGECSE